MFLFLLHLLRKPTPYLRAHAINLALGSFLRAKINYQFLTIAMVLARQCLTLQFFKNDQKRYFKVFQSLFLENLTRWKV